MKYIKLFEEFEPIPGDAPSKDQIHVFDFDDTLAVSKNSSAIALFKNGKPAHQDKNDLIDWLRNMGLDKYDLIKGPSGKTIEKTPNTNIWTAHINSSALAKVKSTKNYDNKYITGSGKIPDQGDTLVIDFTPSAYIGRAKPINPVIDKLKKVKSDGSKAVVMTARSGEGEGISMDNKVIKATNKRDLKSYLKAHGADPDEIFGVSGQNKGQKIKQEFIDGEKNPPEEIHFYDDDEDNIEAVKDLGGKVDAEIFTYGPGKFDKEEANPNRPNDKFKKKR